MFRLLFANPRHDSVKAPPWLIPHAAAILAQIPPFADAPEWRADAGETAAFARSLEYIRQQAYEVKYEALRLRDFVPPATDIPPGAKTWTYRVYDWMGAAQFVSDYANDLPSVEVNRREVTNKIETIADRYNYSIEDIRSSAMMGTNISADKAKAARRAYEIKVEEVGALGDSTLGIPGLLTHPNVPLVLPADTVFTGGWLTGATAAQMLRDLHYVTNKVARNTRRNFTGVRMILPPDEYDMVSTTQLNTTSDKTVLQVFMENNRWIKEVDSWDFLSTADVALTGGRGIVYDPNSEVVELVEPVPFEQLPPQPRGLTFEVPCHGRFGGVVIKQPLGAVYFDFA